MRLGESHAQIFEWNGFCEWVAICLREATTTRRHPILGDVPICARCDAKIEALA
jgi:hypothetical protein